MLNEVAALLVEHGLVPPQRRLHYYVNLTMGESISIGAFHDGRRFLQVKASRFVDLAPEYAAYQRAYADFPVFVPRPLALDVREPWRIMVSDGVDHAPFPARHVLRYREGDLGAVGDLFAFFALAAERADEGAASHAALLTALDQHFASSPHAAIAARCLARVDRADVLALPSWPQHGDLVINNLGVTRGRLVIFDWEDYGRALLPGLDIATLLFSVWSSDPAQLRALASDADDVHGALAAFVRRACAGAHLNHDRFRRLFCLYLLVFLYLKRSYGAGVQEHVGRLLERIVD